MKQTTLNLDLSLKKTRKRGQVELKASHSSQSELRLNAHIIYFDGMAQDYPHSIGFDK